jgi:hypothetical protein
MILRSIASLLDYAIHRSLVSLQLAAAPVVVFAIGRRAPGRDGSPAASLRHQDDAVSLGRYQQLAGRRLPVLISEHPENYGVSIPKLCV